VRLKPGDSRSKVAVPWSRIYQQHRYLLDHPAIPRQYVADLRGLMADQKLLGALKLSFGPIVSA
jgi:hypothetical protein